MFARKYKVLCYKNASWILVSRLWLVLVLQSALLHLCWKIIIFYCLIPFGLEISQMVRFPCRGVFCLALSIFQSRISNGGVAACNLLHSRWFYVPVCSFDNSYYFLYLTSIQTHCMIQKWPASR